MGRSQITGGCGHGRADGRAQAVISFMLGQRSLNVFSQLLEEMAVEDPANLIRLSRLRAAAGEW